MAIKKLYTAHVTSTGGRGQGRAISADGMLDIKIGQPKEMGGTDDGLNPDQLFAAAYSTCLLGTIKYVSAKEKKTVPISSGLIHHRACELRPPLRQERFRHRCSTGHQPPRRAQGDSRQNRQEGPCRLRLFQRDPEERESHDEDRLPVSPWSGLTRPPDLAANQCRTL